MSTIETYTDASRPSASDSSGLCIFNTDSNAIEVSDGTSWFAYNSDGTTGNSLSLEFVRTNSERLDTTYTSGATNAFSVSFWMKSVDTTSYSIFLDSGSPCSNFTLWRPPNGYWYPSFRTTSGTNNQDPNVPIVVGQPNHDDAKTGGASSSFCDGNWHHVVVTLANEDVNGTSTARYIMYKDGSEFVNQLCTTANGWKNNETYIGSSGLDIHTFGNRDWNVTTSLGYTGKMDQMAFFESALTSTEVSTIYNSGNGGDLLTLGFSPDAYYRVGYYSEDTNSDGNVASAGNDIGTVADYSGNNDDASQATASLKPNYVADPAF